MLLLLLLSLLLLLLSIDIGEIVSQRFETFLPYIHNSLRATTFPSPVSLTIRCDRIFAIRNLSEIRANYLYRSRREEAWVYWILLVGISVDFSGQ